MKTQFKHHIKFGSCWYNDFFKIHSKQIRNNEHKINHTKETESNKSLVKTKNHEHKN